MSILGFTIKTLYEIQAQTGAFPSAHYIDPIGFESLRREVAAVHKTPIDKVGTIKVLDVPIRAYDLLPPE